MPPPSWLLLIHQIPPKPYYLRVKARRRLQRVGAVALKNSVYVLPHSDDALEDFQWIVREVVADGGEATLCEAAFLEGVTGEEVERMFNAERDAAYGELAEAARRLGAEGQSRVSDDGRRQLEGEVARLRRRLDEVAALDFFGAPTRRDAHEKLAGIEARLRPPAAHTPAPAAPSEAPRGATWVTRVGVHVDRIASAWLIRRFIDPKARFKFVAPKGYRPEPDEVRFDMYDAEYTHEGERCSFETLLERFALRERALRAIGEIVHDIDLKDDKFGRDETPGVAAVVGGIVAAHDDDATRLDRGGALFDDLYAQLRRRRA